jgi:hypothetical protein
MATTTEWIDERILIPDLLRSAPQARPVLDRYGLRGCGGPLGPVESLAFFAKAHDVPLGRLLDELQVAVGSPTPRSENPQPHASDTIYRPFFKSGIVVVLTLGAVWGAYLLVRIALAGSFTAVGLHEVNAHGHAQIFGWVGLFVMGFAYQAFPRFKHVSLVRPGCAFASLGLLLVGLVARSVCEPLADAVPVLGDLAIAGGVLEVVAIAAFAWIIVATLRSSQKPFEAYDWYVVCALFWFVGQAVYEAVYLAATLTAVGDARLALVATWQGALRDIQIHGFALLMILGVSQRLFHHFYGLPAPSRRLSLRALVALNAAVLGEAAGLILMRLAGHAWAALWYASVLLLTAAVMGLVSNWHIFSPSEERDRSLKYLRAAYVWLFISLGMLVLLPAYQFGLLGSAAPDSAAAQLGFSHAYYGAIRHAITVGFISLMIVGVAAKVVPTLNGLNVRALAPLWLPFILINAGCAMRVVGQTLTDFTASSFPFTGVSGLFEVTGLALWGMHLWRIMAGRVKERESVDPPSGYTWMLPGSPVEAKHRVGDVLDYYPELLDVFLNFGFHPLASPLLRKTIARHVTIARACRQLNVNADELLAALNAARVPQRGERLNLPVLS